MTRSVIQQITLANAASFARLAQKRATMYAINRNSIGLLKRSLADLQAQSPENVMVVVNFKHEVMGVMASKFSTEPTVMFDNLTVSCVVPAPYTEMWYMPPQVTVEYHGQGRGQFYGKVKARAKGRDLKFHHYRRQSDGSYKLDSIS